MFEDVSIKNHCGEARRGESHFSIFVHRRCHLNPLWHAHGTRIINGHVRAYKSPRHGRGSHKKPVGDFTAGQPRSEKNELWFLDKTNLTTATPRSIFAPFSIIILFHFLYSLLSLSLYQRIEKSEIATMQRQRIKRKSVGERGRKKDW